MRLLLSLSVVVQCNVLVTKMQLLLFLPCNHDLCSVVQLQVASPQKNLPAAAWWLQGGLGGCSAAGAAAGDLTSPQVMPILLQLPAVSAVCEAAEGPADAAGAEALNPEGSVISALSGG